MDDKILITKEDGTEVELTILLTVYLIIQTHQKVIEFQLLTSMQVVSLVMLKRIQINQH